MLVLKILGIIAFVYFVYWVYLKISSYCIEKYNYDLFDFTHLTLVSVSYLFFYYGHHFYNIALQHNWDTLNGIILILIGLIPLVLVITLNFIHLPFFKALLFTLFELVIAVVFAGIALVGIVVAISFAMQTRPVYRID